MPIRVSSYFLPTSPNTPYILQDKYLYGGFRVVADEASRDLVHMGARKIGMWVMVQDSGTIFTLKNGIQNTDWEPVNFSTQSRPTRNEVQLQPGEIQPGAYVDITQSIAKTLMLLDCSVNLAGIKIQAYENSARIDENPYTFLSKSSRLSDTGITVLDDGSELRKRRYGFLSNQESTPTTDTFWRITNENTIAVTPVIDVKYLVME